MAKMDFVFKDDGCIECTSHKLNKDGYLRKRVNGKLIMYHRHVWRLENDMEVPSNHEIHHKCHNRACVNILHLELIDTIQHTILTNKERYSKRIEQIKEYLRLNKKETAISISKKFGVFFLTVCRYRRDLNAETH
jgi:hypothetical protein